MKNNRGQESGDRSQGTGVKDQGSSPLTPDSCPLTPAVPPLESVLCTEELNRRPSRPPDYEGESRALVSLAQALADSPGTILQTLADTILEVFQADSSGISLVTEDGTRFQWPAIAGVWKPHIGGGTPRDFGPCGDVLDRNVPLMFSHFERRYTYFQSVMPSAEECLLVPFYVKGKAVGTIWAIVHDDKKGARKFDSEDLRMLVNLGTFASAAYQAVEQLNSLIEQAHERRGTAQSLREMNEALLISSVRQHELTEEAQEAGSALRESEATLRLSQQAARAGTWTWEGASGVVTWSDECYELFGIDPQTPLIYESWRNVLHPDDRVRVDSVARQAMERQEKLNVEYRVNHSQRGERWLTSIGRVIDPVNRPGCMTGITLDITDRMQTEEMLSCQRQAFEMVAEGAPMLEVLEHLVRRTESLSPQYALVAIHLLDEAGEHFVQTVAFSLPPEYSQAVDGMAVSSASSSCCAAVAGRRRVVVPDIADCPEWPAFASFTLSLGLRAAASTPIISSAGKVLGSFVIYYCEVHSPDPHEKLLDDIVARTASVVVERSNIERALHASEVRYRRLFESSNDGVLILDFISGKIVDANPFMSELLGYSNADFVGKELWEIGLFSDKSANESAVRELQEKGFLRYEHLPLESNHGRQVEVEIVASVYREDQVDVIQYNIRDITERSLLERKLAEQALALNELHRRKDEFLAMLSHELRSPLAPIANAVQLLGLQRGHESLIQQQARGIIERQTGQLQLLINDLLEVSRITTGQVHLHRERLAVSRIVEGAVETVRPLIDELSHELTVSLPSEPIWLYADSARLQQVLINLLNNAAKYTDDGGHVWLTVELEDDKEMGRQGDGETRICGERDNKDGSSVDASPPLLVSSSLPLPHSPSHVVIRVRDTGVGIAASLLPHIFDLFTQAERSLDRSHGGLGIGLALVQRLTELHGGKVEVHSILGQGSEFIVRLPMMPTDLPQPNLPLTETGPPTTRPLRVLVVDDNVDTVLSLSMLFRASGHDVRTALDGLSAVQIALEYQPDVAFLDIGLPGLDGYEVAKRIRQQPILQAVLLVALTGYSRTADLQTALNAGFDYHLVKPADFKKVKEILAIVAKKVT